MKKIVIIVTFFAFISCEKEGILTSTKSQSGVISSTATITSVGTFNPTSGIAVTGNAKVFLDSGVSKLQLENFSISSGPDLKVYLSTTTSPTTFVNLGNLNPSTIYTIPASVNLNVYKYVLIHCQIGRAHV